MFAGERDRGGVGGVPLVAVGEGGEALFEVRREHVALGASLALVFGGVIRSAIRHLDCSEKALFGIESKLHGALGAD